jgi:hypothetical protein
MSMIAGQTYKCTNPTCRCEVKVIRLSATGRQNPRCGCGAEMKKPYSPPILRELPSNTEVRVGRRTHND